MKNKTWTLRDSGEMALALLVALIAWGTVSPWSSLTHVTWAAAGLTGGGILAWGLARKTGVSALILAGLPILGFWGSVTLSLNIYEGIKGSSIVLAAVLPWAMSRSWRLKALDASQKENMAAALEARMRPHFIFNALNAIAALSARSGDYRTEDAALDLADILRVLMKRDPGVTIFAEELALTRRYAELEKLRFGDRLDIEWRIAEGLNSVIIPWLSLQPIVENAIVHGVEKVGKGKMTVSAFEADGNLVFIVDNPYDKNNKKAGNSMGTTNLRERLNLIFDGKAKLSCSSATDNTWRTILAIPLKRKSSVK